MKKRMFSILLALCMTLCIMPMSAFANGTTAKSIMLGTNGISGYDSTNGYDYIYFGKWNDNAVKWRVLDDTSNNKTSGLFLLCDELIGTGEDGGVYFDNTSPYSNVWQGSDAQNWCKDFAGESATDNVPDAFTSGELDAILNTTKSDAAFSTFNECENILNNDKVFFLSAEEVSAGEYGFTDDAARVAQYKNNDKLWWLRSPYYYYEDGVGAVNYNGKVGWRRVNRDGNAVRPAFNLNPSPILFTSAAAGGKPDGFNAVLDYGGSDLKLTLLDNSRSGFTAEILKTNTKTYISYSGAKTGTNEYISALIKDTNGNVTYYGRIANATSESSTVELDLSGVTLNNDDTLYIFNEQYNGEYNTDYASELKAVTVPNTPNVYNITVQTDGNGSAYANFDTAKVGTEITLTATPDIGYVLKEWKSINGDVTVTNNKFVMPSKDVSVKAVFESKQYAVYYDLDDGSTPQNKTVCWNDLVIADTNNPSRDGYNFCHWTFGGNTVDINSTYADLVGNDDVTSITLTAQWEEKTTYTVSVPSTQVGYTLSASKTSAYQDDEITVSYSLLPGYCETDNFSVKINGTEITLENGQYTFNITKDAVITVEGVADITAPTVEIEIAKNKWNTFWNNITFGLFFKDTQTVSVIAEDNGSGINAVYYYLSDKELTKEQAQTVTGWALYNGGFDINPDNSYVVYVKAVDNAGNTVIINSDKIVLDSVSPVITGVENGKTYYGETVITVSDTNIDKIYLDENEISSLDEKITVTADNASHTLKITDKAGNESLLNFTVYKIYNVTFIVDGQIYATQQVNYGCDALLPTIPAKLGYDQIAPIWDKDGKNITSDTTITAVYTVNNYTVSVPNTQVGYTLNADKTNVAYGETVKLSYSLLPGYCETDNFAVKINGTEITLENGQYTFNITKDAVITVEGVADITDCEKNDGDNNSFDEADENNDEADENNINHTNYTQADMNTATEQTVSNKDYSNSEKSDDYSTYDNADGKLTKSNTTVNNTAFNNKTFNNTKSNNTKASSATVTKSERNKSPKTDDQSNILLWVFLLILCGASVISVNVYGKNKQDK